MTTPINSLDTDDPGDETHLRYRYQSGYGTILLIAMQMGTTSYQRLWCEQWEDFLGELPGGIFDAFQVKSRDAGQGKWKVTDEQFTNAIKRFVDLDSKFPGKVRRFCFVSNMPSYIAREESRQGASPHQLLTQVNGTTGFAGLPAVHRTALIGLSATIQQPAAILFDLLKRTDFIVGPDINSFIEVISQTHLSKLPLCTALNAQQLSDITLRLVDLVSRASAKHIDDPLKHIMAQNRDLSNNPILTSKALNIGDVQILIQDALRAKTHYPAEFYTLGRGDAKLRQSTMEQKLNRGGLSSYVEITKRRAISAEAALLSLTGDADEGLQKCADIETIVLGVCQDEHAKVSIKHGGANYGQQMFIEVLAKLQELADNDSLRVHFQPYDNLVGIAGLLTGDCKVWWSDRFQLEDNS